MWSLVESMLGQHAAAVLATLTALAGLALRAAWLVRRR